MYDSHPKSEIILKNECETQKNERRCSYCGGMIIFSNYSFICSECGIVYAEETISNGSYLNDDRRSLRRKKMDIFESANIKLDNNGMSLATKDVNKTLKATFSRLFKADAIRQNTAEVRFFKLIENLKRVFPITDLMRDDLKYYAKKIPVDIFQNTGANKLYYYEVVSTMLGYILKERMGYPLEEFATILAKQFNVKFTIVRYRFVLSLINHIPTLQPIFKNNPETIVDDFFNKVKSGITEGVSNLAPEMLQKLSSFMVEKIDDPKKIDTVNMKSTLVDLSFKAIKKFGYKTVSNYNIPILSAVGVYIGSQEKIPKQYIAKLFGICRGSITNRVNDFNQKMKKVKSCNQIAFGRRNAF